MNILRVGDPHIRPSNIEEADRLMFFVKQTILSNKIDRLEILGDLCHTHAIVRIEVLDFWNKWLQIFSDIVETVVLVGNHDQTGDKNSGSHALKVFKHISAQNPNLRIVDRPTQIGIYGYMPYIHSNEEFVKEAKRLTEKGGLFEVNILVCHATFDGSQYDNEFYAPGGINPDDIPVETIISGHIHKQQIIANGKVDYPGTAYWQSASDANENKGIWQYAHDNSTGKVLSRDLISTAHVCTPIVSFTWLEGQEAPTIPEGARATVELVGSSDWISKQKVILKGKVGIKSKITDQKRSNERKAGNSLENYLVNLYNTNMNRDALLSYAREIGIV